jgi:hypothetical protein
MKPSKGFQFALPEQKWTGQTGFLWLCAACYLHTYDVPDNGRAAQSQSCGISDFFKKLGQQATTRRKIPSR